MNQNTLALRAAYNGLSSSEKGIIRFYLEMPLEELEKKAVQQGELFETTRSNEKKPTFARQAFLYSLAYGMKKKGLTGKGGGKTRRAKKRGTRRRRV